MTDTGRIEAFSDGVLAIIITIMVLELTVPHDVTFGALKPLLPEFLAYVLSFIYLGLYWNNHHHMFQITKRINGGVLWANLHLLFWLSLFPFTTAWMSESNFSAIPTAVYGFILLMAAFAWVIVQRTIIAEHGADSLLASAVENSFKENVSLLLYLAGIPLTFVRPWIGGALYAVVALIWLVSDRRVERILAEEQSRDGKSK